MVAAWAVPFICKFSGFRGWEVGTRTFLLSPLATPMVSPYCVRLVSKSTFLDHFNFTIQFLKRNQGSMIA